MKIGIITYWDSLDNYGQQLQCYALQTLLRSWGYDAFLIRYAPEKKKKTIWDKMLTHLQHPEYIMYHLPFGSEMKRNARLEEQLRKHNKEINPQRGFEQFREEHLKMTPQIYHSFAELETNPPDADVYITGSDQVWHNPYNEESIKGQFLQFGSNETKRISYAACIGRSLKKSELPLFRKFLKCFDAVSVREDTACQLCIEEGFKAQVCIDPTMLLSVDNYRDIAMLPNGGKKYAFMYVLNMKSAEEFYWPSIKKYLNEMHLELKSVTGSGYYQARELIDGHKNLLATLPEWIGYIQQADCVFTTSFHGTVFAILMHRPFLTIGLQGRYSCSNSRMDQLLGMLGIPERMFNPQMSIQQQMDNPINWQEIDQRIDKMKFSSLQFLKDNLK